MDVSEDGDVCSEVDVPPKDTVKASSNGEADKEKMQEADGLVVDGIAKDSSSVQNGGINNCVSEPGSLSSLGYLTMSDGCLMFKTSNSDRVDVNSAMNGCESEKKDASDPAAQSDDVEGETGEAADIESRGNDNVTTLADNSTAQSPSSPAGETDSVQADGTTDSPVSNTRDMEKEPNCTLESTLESDFPNTESHSPEAADPVPSIVNDSSDLQSGSIVDGEKSDQSDGVAASAESVAENVQTSSPARERDGENDSQVDAVGEDGSDSVSRLSQPSPVPDCSVDKDDADKSGVEESTAAEAVGTDSADKPEVLTATGASESNDTGVVDHSDQASNWDLCVDDSSASVTSSRADSAATQSKKGEEDPVTTPPTVENVTPSNWISVSQPLGITTPGGAVQPQVSLSKSTARKSVPGGDNKARPVKATARKTGQPQAVLKALVTPSNKGSGEGTIKIVNFHPNSNITLKLSELENVLKVTDLAKANHPRGPESAARKDGSPAVECVKRASEASLKGSSPGWESATSDASPAQNANSISVSSQFGLKAQHRRRRKKGGTYDFPGVKKLPKRKKMSVTATGSESRDERGSGDFEPLRKVIKKPRGSPRRQYTMVELFKNRQFHKRQTTRDGLMRRKSPDSPLAKKKTVSQMLEERRRSGGQLSDWSSEQKSLSHPQLLTEKQLSGSRALVLVSDAASEGRTASQLPGEKWISAEPMSISRPEGEKKQMVQKLFVSSTVISFCK